MVLQFPILADYAYISVDGLRIFATHGHNFNTTKLPPLAKGDILLHGHTHVPVVEEFGEGNYYINPGSLSIPKESSPKSYILYENGRFSFRTLEGEEYKCFCF
jgi:predicted phosphodiesterase